MIYTGKLYARVAGKYIELEETAEDFDTLKAQRDELLAALKTYGAHLPNCAYAVNHPLIDKCTCGYEAAIAKPAQVCDIEPDRESGEAIEDRKAKRAEERLRYYIKGDA